MSQHRQNGSRGHPGQAIRLGDRIRMVGVSADHMLQPTKPPTSEKIQICWNFHRLITFQRVNIRPLSLNIAGIKTIRLQLLMQIVRDMAQLWPKPGATAKV